MSDAVLVCTLVGGLFIACLAWLLLKRLAYVALLYIVTSFLPLERKALEWLQDRAMARTLGVDVDVIRMRRRMETLREPVDMPNQ